VLEAVLDRTEDRALGGDRVDRRVDRDGQDWVIGEAQPAP